jgi:hypothetical protein
MMNDVSNSDSGPPRQRRSKLAPAARTAQSASIQYYNSPDWWRLRAAIMNALHDFPEARESVVRALRSLDALKDSDGAS